MSAETAPADKLIGQVLASRYQILERLGEGAMGVVYRARHVKVGRAFAVKVLHPQLLVDPKVVLRFEREAELAGRLRHANVVGVVDVGEIDGMRYMVMDFAEGPDLAALLVEAPMPAERIIGLVRQILEGLYHAHEQGLIHRDLKPENVIIERDAHGDELPRIVDFGIAILRDSGDTGDGQGRLTTNGLVLGTPHYMAPEQAVADAIDHRIDLFALGIVTYELLCGQLPFDGSGAEVARANLLLDPPAIAVRVPYLEVDPLLEAFARRLMSKRPSDRPATAKAARELLDLIVRDRPAAAAALNLPPLTSGRWSVQTWPVLPQGPDTATTAASEAPETRRLQATPSPQSPPASLPGPSAPVLSGPTAWGPVAPGPVPPGPVAFSAGAPAPHDPRVVGPRPASAGEPSMPRRSRAGWILAAVGGAAIVVGLIARSMIGPAPSAPAVEPNTPPAASNAPPAASTSVPPAPSAVAAIPPALPAPDPAAASPAVVPARVSDDPGGPSENHGAQPDARHDQRLATGRPRPATRPADLRTGTAGLTATRSTPTTSASSPPATAVRAAEPPAVAPTTTAPAAAAPAPSPAAASPTPATAVPPVAPPRAPSAGRPGDAIAVPPSSGVEPKALARLYYAIPALLGRLPAAQSQDLRDELRLYDVQALMTGPQGARDRAAARLFEIFQEARRRAAAPAP